jgi:hypothetical protein
MKKKLWSALRWPFSAIHPFAIYFFTLFAFALVYRTKYVASAHAAACLTSENKPAARSILDDSSGRKRIGPTVSEL